MRRLICIALLLPFLAFTPAIYAQDLITYETSAQFLSEDEVIDYSSLLINEVMPDPEGSDTDYEWIEIYNDGLDEMDLSECTIDGEQFPQETIIPENSFLVVAKDLLDEGDQDGQSFEQRWGNNSSIWGDFESEDYVALQLPISLKNSDDSVTLSCPDYEYVFSWEQSESGKSLSLDTDGEITDAYLVTPGKPNIAPEPIVYEHSVQISEVYPTPRDGEYEWIELYNYGENEIALGNWIIEDNSSASVLEEGLLLKPQSYIVVSEERLPITLNNSGEVISLYDPNEELVDEFDYESTSLNISNIRKWANDHYMDEIVQTQKLTPGAGNEYIDPDDLFYGKENLTIKQVREKEFGEEVVTAGVITVEPNLLGKKTFYIQDNTSAIQVYVSDEAYAANLKKGMKLKIFAELKEYKGESRLYVGTDGTILSDQVTNTAKPIELKTGNVGESEEGKLVVIVGKVSETSGTSFFVDDGSGQIKVLIKSTTDIDTPKKKKGQYAGVVGIVSQYGDDTEGNPSYRVLPRYTTDIVISDTPLTAGQVLAVTGGSTTHMQLSGLVLVLALALSFKMKKTNIEIVNK